MSAGVFHRALPASAYQALRGVSESGYLSQKARGVDMAMILMAYYDTNLVTLQLTFWLGPVSDVVLELEA